VAADRRYSARVSLTPGQSFDRYTIEGPLGEGGMGEVYQALDTKLRRRVALKLLQAEALAEPSRGEERRARLLREARAAARIEHPNAVAIYDVGEFEGRPYIAMELVEGRTMRAAVGDGAIPLEQRLQWLVDVARALAAAHKNGLVHRDIKPENVMIRSDGAIKVLDFGIARRTQGDEGWGRAETEHGGIATITQRGAVVGTPLYMSPEQMRGDALDGRSDQFSWAVLAYELLSGIAPWQAEDALGIVSQILSGEPRPLGELVPALSGATSATVTKCLSKRPEQRFLRMEEAAAALVPGTAELMESGVPPATQTSAEFAPARSDRRSGAHWPVLLLSLSALVALGVGLNYPHRRSGTADSAPTRPNPEALAAYQAALQAQRDGAAWGPLLRKASELDPTLAAAHLRLAMMFGGISAPSRARDNYRKAVQQRAALTERDLGLLDALEPLLARDPPELAEWERRLRVLVERWPTDVELLDALILCHFVRGKFLEAEPLIGRQLEADPRYARGWWGHAAVRKYQGDVRGVHQAIEACLALSPGATKCLTERIEVDLEEGDCAAVEADARRIVTIDPQAQLGYALLGRAFVARGRSPEVSMESLRQGWARAPESERRAIELEDTLHLAALRGDFEQALSLAAELETVLGSSGDEAPHADLARIRAEIYAETGRPKEAAQVAQAFLARRDAWARPVFLEDFSFARDAVARMLAAELRGALISAAQLEQAREAWLRGWDAKLEGEYRGILWLHAYADIVETPAEAMEALARREEFPRLTPHRPETLADAQIGRVLLLAGRPGEAEPLLARATANCRVLDEPLEHTRAYRFLGQAREALQDRAGACAAYRALLDRWGNAKLSVSAGKARERVLALDCP